VLCARGAHAVETLTLDLPEAQGAGWSARGVKVTLSIAAEPLRATLDIAQLTLPAPVGVLQSVSVRCDALRLERGAYACDDALAVLDSRHRDRIALRGAFAWTPDTDALDVDATFDGPAGESMRVRARVDGDDWRVAATTDGYPVAALAPWLGDVIAWSPTTPASGMLALVAEATGRGGALERLGVDARLDGLSFSAYDDRLATEALAGAVRLDVHATEQGAWAVAAELRGEGGQAYADPWFVDAGTRPFVMQGSGTLDAARTLTLDTLAVDQPGVLRATGRAVADRDGLRTLALDIADARLPGAYEVYLQPLLIGTVLDELETQGGARGRLEIEDGTPTRCELVLDRVYAEDRNGRFGVYGARGDVRWVRDTAGPPPVTSVSYEGASLYGIPFDAGRVRLETAGSALRLLDTPLRAPLLDGALVVHTLALRGIGGEDVEADFDAVLEPVDVTRLTSALGWVPFSGTLSGRLPTLRYADGVLTLGGALEADVFGGSIAIDGVRIERPLGVLPALFADVRMRNIDLERLTSTFSFGRMTGRLHADVLGLEVLDWQAQRFDARVYTPEDDDSRHRISQRAVNSIASIGGGIAAGLQKGIMRLFDEFAYDRIDLGCRMRDQVCQMSGIAARGDGYYILRGKGLPRIDVVGYERSVSWPAFSSALVEAARSRDVLID
jgi:hypothetical protein